MSSLDDVEKLDSPSAYLFEEIYQFIEQNACMVTKKWAGQA